MWAIYHKTKDGLAWQTETSQFLIFHSKAEAWSFLLNKVKIAEPEDFDNLDVIEICWSKI